jgi:hypothetical protein
MALVPKINICIQSKCDKIDVYEQTGPYDATNNDEGWSNSGTTAGHIDTSEIQTAVLSIYDYLQNTLYETITLKDTVSVDVYTGVTGAPAPANFLAVSGQAWTQPDGVYKLVYVIDDGSSTYTNDTQYALLTCNLENCLDGLKKKAITECNSKTLSNIKDKIDQIELLIYGIESAFSCNDMTTVVSLIKSGTTICDNLCDCGCGDC